MPDDREMRSPYAIRRLGVDDRRGRNGIRYATELTPCDDKGRATPRLIRPYGKVPSTNAARSAIIPCLNYRVRGSSKHIGSTNALRSMPCFPRSP
jgi:hypothetical protein